MAFRRNTSDLQKLVKQSSQRPLWGQYTKRGQEGVNHRLELDKGAEQQPPETRLWVESALDVASHCYMTASGARPEMPLATNVENEDITRECANLPKQEQFIKTS